MLKKLSIGVLVTLLFLVLGLNYVGITPAYIIYGPGVASGIASKLLCSARYVSGYSDQLAFDDLVQYSPILSQVTTSYDDSARSVTANLFGLSDTTARYIPGLGCAVDYDSQQGREQLVARQAGKSKAAWPAGSGVDTINQAFQAAVDGVLQRDNASGLNTRALLVVHRGQVVAEAYAQEATPDMPLLGWSMAKSLTAVMLGNLEMRGLIDLRGKPGFEKWQADERSTIGIEHMLTMTDGLRFSETYEPGDDATAMLFTSPSSAGYVLGKPLRHEPGAVFNYSSGTANLLARLYVDTLGSPQRSYDDFMQFIYEPAGFQNAVFETDASGVWVGSSYFYASARDWARLGQLMLQGGVINGHRIVAREWVERATSPNGSANEKAYGYQWWLNRGDEQLRFPDLPQDAYFANGNRQQILMVIPSRQAVIVRLGWTAGGYPTNDNFSGLLEQLPR